MCLCESVFVRLGDFVSVCFCVTVVVCVLELSVVCVVLGERRREGERGGLYVVVSRFV